MVKLRPFQAKMESDIYQAWNEPRVINVMPVAATGSGKTVLLAKIISDEPGASIAIAHRQELISQISTALARNGVRHKLIGSNATLLRAISAIHMFELGNSYINPNAKVAVGGVDTLLRMSESFPQVKLMVQDEGHHCLRENKWGKVASKFPNARGLLPSATPYRADGKGLGRHADGIVDKLVLAPTMRDIINMGYLTDYRIYAPPNMINRKAIKVSENTGDFNMDSMREVVHGSSIVGNVVQHYLKIAKGKLGLTYAVDVQSAIEIASAFRSAGVPAEVITAKTPDYLRYQILRKHKNREILQIVNVDLFGEGTDIPELEVVSFARPTMSYGLYVQHYRVLRLVIPEEYKASYDSYDDATRKAIIAASNKPHGIVIDHVGNVFAHGLPDKYREWSLDRKDSKNLSKSTAVPLRVCINTQCALAYEKIYKYCPYCNTPSPIPTNRSSPEFVDGDLTELSPEYLAQLRGEIESSVKIPYGATPQIITHLRNLHLYKRESREVLKNYIAWWAGLQHSQGYDESQSYRLFFYKYGVDVANAQLLSKKEMDELSNKINVELIKAGVKL